MALGTGAQLRLQRGCGVAEHAEIGAREGGLLPGADGGQQTDGAALLAQGAQQHPKRHDRATGLQAHAIQHPRIGALARHPPQQLARQGADLLRNILRRRGRDQICVPERRVHRKVRALQPLRQ